jgi:hypothetical protein
MAEYNLTALMEKYDAQEVEDDLANLEQEVADEDAVAAVLAQDSGAKADAVEKFLADNVIPVTDQHARMKAMVGDLKEKVASNQHLEEDDAEYAALVASEAAQDMARMLAEMNAMSDEYQDLLLATGRVGRPPL